MGRAPDDVPPLLPHDELPVGTVLGGRYRLERRIGSGGMGTVYAADDLSLGRAVALKIISRAHTAEPRQLERFRREARVAEGLRHPHVIDVLDVGQLDGREYLAMELLEGIDLCDAIGLCGSYEPDDAIQILDQALQALEAAHAAGLVHRDLKPENIFLSQLPSGDLHVKLLDFGVVKVPEDGAQGHLTRTGTVVGTPEYMAPEQAMTGNVDARADLYAVGCVAMAMLCGRPPFQNKSVLLVMSAHVTETPPRPSRLRPELKAAAAVDAFIGKALEKDPGRRYQSAAEMRRALHLLARELGAPLAGRITMPPARSREGAVPASVPRSSPLAKTLMPGASRVAAGPPPPAPAPVAPAPVAPAPVTPAPVAPAPAPVAPAKLVPTPPTGTPAVVAPEPRRAARSWLLLVLGVTVGASAASLIMWLLLRR